MLAIQNVLAPIEARQVEASSTELLLQGTLAQVRQLRTVTQQSGLLALESIVGIASIGAAPEWDRPAYTSKRALLHSANAAALALYQEGAIDAAVLRHVKGGGHSICVNIDGSAPQFYKIRAVMPQVFRRENGQDITSSEHVGLARRSLAIPWILANKSFPVMEELVAYLSIGPPTRGGRFDPDKFTIAEGPEGQALTFADHPEMRALIHRAKGEFSKSPAASLSRGKCMALGAKDDEGNLVEATWNLMLDVQQAEAMVSSKDRAVKFARSVLKRTLAA